MQLLIADCYYW